MLDFEWEWLLRIVCAALIGGVVGYERHNRSKEAGLRTHMIVAMASALLMIVSKYGFVDVQVSDPARIAAQVVSGIGFLGAGIIFIRNDSVLGLTTAAGIWATAAVGMALGAGFYVLGIATGVLIVIIQIIIRVVFDYTTPRTSIRISIDMEAAQSGTAIHDLSRTLKKLELIQSDNKISHADEGARVQLVTNVVTMKEIDPATVLADIAAIPGVIKVEFL